MKTFNRYIIIAFVCLTTLSSCSDYLEEENLGNITAENFYNTEDGYEGLVNSVYSSVREVYQPTPYVFCAGTDLFFAAHQEVPIGLAAYQTLTPSNGQVEELFSTTYQSIQICNLGMHYADKTEIFPNLSSRVAEVRTIRAFLYFILVQQFGDTTIVTDLISEPITHFERNPESEVYQFIIDELLAAITDLPTSQSDFGRITKRAAQHILAKVYLTRGYQDYAVSTDFSDAAVWADEAISGQALNLNFADLFAYGNDNNPEVLWSIQYSPGSTINGGAHNWDYPWGPLVQGADDGVNKKNVLHPTEYLYTLFEDNDVRFEGTFLNVKTTPYSGWRIDRENSPVQYYYPRTADQIANVDLWRSEDPTNRANTIISPLAPHWWDGLNQTDFPGLSKFDRIQTSTPSIQYTHDLYLARLAETYLIAAEAYLQNNEIGTALNRINEVRNRAGASTLSQLDIDILLDERARELAGEGLRWLDLKRTGKLMETTKIRNPDIQKLYDEGIDPFLGKNGNYKILRPIPLSAIALDSGDYPQNPAY
ncbi:RagB/SusD family nutrient uptake outer membrane protein [Formosa sp. A9]|uniref:RagB/SusD family nutrient uptake outer membrane protein n=1 Tax=Formosa sp. A9 TaxID=3442641 RepID=UPI003EC0C8A4